MRSRSRLIETGRAVERGDLSLRQDPPAAGLQTTQLQGSERGAAKRQSIVPDRLHHAADLAVPSLIDDDAQLSASEVAMIAPPSFHFDTKPASQTAFVGDDVTLTALANMTATYQWRFTGTNLPGATNTSLPLTNVLDKLSIGIVSTLYVKIIDLVLAFVLFKVVHGEVTRYRNTSPDLPPSLRL